MGKKNKKLFNDLDFLCIRTYVLILKRAMLYRYNSDRRLIELLLKMIIDEEGLLNKKGDPIVIDFTVSSNLMRAEDNIITKITDFVDADTEKFEKYAPKYFREKVCPKMTSNNGTIADVIASFVNLIQNDNGGNGDIPISDETKASFLKLAKKETLAEFLASVFLYAINRENMYINKNNTEITLDASTSDYVAEPWHNTNYEHTDFIRHNLEPLPKYFADPHNYLEKIETVFDETDYYSRKPKYLILSGRKGTGKSTFAKKFAWISIKLNVKYETIWQFNAKSREDAMNSAKYFLYEAGINLPATADMETIYEAFHKWFKQNDNWLLIFCHDTWCTKDYLPEIGRGHVIITSRYVSEPGEVLEINDIACEEIEIEPFPVPAALKLLFDSIHQDASKLSESELHYAEQVVKKLNCLPSKLAKTAEYLVKYKEGGFESYFRILEHFEQFEVAALNKNLENYIKANPGKKLPDYISLGVVELELP